MKISGCMAKASDELELRNPDLGKEILMDLFLFYVLDHIKDYAINREIVAVWIHAAWWKMMLWIM